MWPSSLHSYDMTSDPRYLTHTHIYALMMVDLMHCSECLMTFKINVVVFNLKSADGVVLRHPVCSAL